jgi:hypothetical protein
MINPIYLPPGDKGMKYLQGGPPPNFNAQALDMAGPIVAPQIRGMPQPPPPVMPGGGGPMPTQGNPFAPASHPPPGYGGAMPPPMPSPLGVNAASGASYANSSPGSAWVGDAIGSPGPTWMQRLGRAMGNAPPLNDARGLAMQNAGGLGMVMNQARNPHGDPRNESFQRTMTQRMR